MDSDETAAREHARVSELIVDYDCRVYAHVDVERREVVRLVVDEGALGHPSVVDGPRGREREGVAIAEAGGFWPSWDFGP